jgi:hypothetical protein
MEGPFAYAFIYNIDLFGVQLFETDTVTVFLIKFYLFLFSIKFLLFFNRFNFLMLKINLTNIKIILIYL